MFFMNELCGLYLFIFFNFRFLRLYMSVALCEMKWNENICKNSTYVVPVCLNLYSCLCFCFHGDHLSEFKYYKSHPREVIIEPTKFTSSPHLNLEEKHLSSVEPPGEVLMPCTQFQGHIYALIYVCSRTVSGYSLGTVHYSNQTLQLFLLIKVTVWQRYWDILKCLGDANGLFKTHYKFRFAFI